MSDLTSISRQDGTAITPPAPAPTITLPHTLELPTRYYGRLALEETVRDFAEIAKIATRVGDGVLVVTFQEIESDVDEVVGEFLNHVLYRSAQAPEIEVAR